MVGSPTNASSGRKALCEKVVQLTRITQNLICDREQHEEALHQMQKGHELDLAKQLQHWRERSDSSLKNMKEVYETSWARGKKVCQEAMTRHVLHWDERVGGLVKNLTAIKEAQKSQNELLERTHRAWAKQRQEEIEQRNILARTVSESAEEKNDLRAQLAVLKAEIAPLRETVRAPTAEVGCVTDPRHSNPMVLVSTLATTRNLFFLLTIISRWRVTTVNEKERRLSAQQRDETQKLRNRTEHLEAIRKSAIRKVERCDVLVRPVFAAWMRCLDQSRSHKECEALHLVAETASLRAEQAHKELEECAQAHADQLRTRKQSIRMTLEAACAGSDANFVRCILYQWRWSVGRERVERTSLDSTGDEQSMSGKLDAAENECQALCGKLEVVENECRSLCGKLEAAENECRASCGKLEAAENECRAACGKLEAAENECQAVYGKLEVAEHERQTACDKLEETQREYEIAHVKSEARESESKELRVALEKAESVCLAIRGKSEAAESAVVGMRIQLDVAREDARAVRGRLQESEYSITHLRDQFEKLTTTYAGVSTKRERLQDLFWEHSMAMVILSVMHRWRDITHLARRERKRTAAHVAQRSNIIMAVERTLSLRVHVAACVRAWVRFVRDQKGVRRLEARHHFAAQCGFSMYFREWGILASKMTAGRRLKYTRQWAHRMVDQTAKAMLLRTTFFAWTLYSRFETAQSHLDAEREQRDAMLREEHERQLASARQHATSTASNRAVLEQELEVLRQRSVGDSGRCSEQVEMLQRKHAEEIVTLTARAAEFEQSCQEEYKSALNAALEAQKHLKAPPLTVICPREILRTNTRHKVEKRLPPLNRSHIRQPS